MLLHVIIGSTSNLFWLPFVIISKDSNTLGLKVKLLWKNQNPVIGLSYKFLFSISGTSIHWNCETVQALIASILSLVWWRSIFAVFGLLNILTWKNLCFTEKIHWNTRLAASDVFHMLTQSINDDNSIIVQMSEERNSSSI